MGAHNKIIIMAELTAQETKQFSEVFEMFDEAGDNKVPIGKVGDMMNTMGWNATTAELTNCRKAAKLGEGVDLSLETYLQFMGVWTSLKPPKHSDQAPGDAMRYDLMGCGEPLSQEEMDQLMREADTDGDGNIDFEEFVALMRGGVTIQF